MDDINRLATAAYYKAMIQQLSKRGRQLIEAAETPEAKRAALPKAQRYYQLAKSFEARLGDLADAVKEYENDD